jgi:hypothetical protein
VVENSHERQLGIIEEHLVQEIESVKKESISEQHCLLVSVIKVKLS